MPDSASRLRLHAEEGPDRRSVAVPSGGASIGRAIDCDICLAHTDVSRAHARIDLDAGTWWLTDLGGRNGTHLDGRRLPPRERNRLDDGARVMVGPWSFRAEIERPPGGAGDDVAFFRRGGAAGVATGTYSTRGTIFMRLRQDDPAARELSWEEFRARYAPVIVGFARNAGAPAQDADDILQDVLLSFFRISPEFEYDPSKGRFRGYLKRATLNAIRQRARRRRPAERLEVDPPGEDEGGAEAAWEAEWAAAVLRRAIDEARGAFEARTFEAFELCAHQSMPVDEVARRLGLSAASVRQAKSRVSRSVRAIVQRIRDEEG